MVVEAGGLSVLDRNLMSGERMLWRGKPLPGPSFVARDALTIPFSLLWAGFAVYWNVSVWKTGAPLAFKPFGLPFLIMGLYISVGRFVVEASTRRRLEYGVTDRRILIGKRGSGSVRSIDLKHLPVLDLKERADGTGSIEFAASPVGGFGLQLSAVGIDPTPRFLRIANARTVYEIIARAAG